MRVKILFLAVLLGAAALFAVSRAPAPPAAVFYGKSGAKVTLADFKGRAVLVNLWASWCAPCLEELPSLGKLQKDFGGKLAVVAISMDAEDKSAFFGKRAPGLAFYWDKDRVIPLIWSYKGLPTSYLFDARGRQVERFDGGFDWGAAAVREKIKEAVDGAS